MKVLHLIGGGDVGGAKSHVLTLVKELSKNIDVEIISFRTGIFAEDAESLGINIEVVKTGNLFKDISIVLNIIKQGNYDILHSHGAKANMVSVILKLLTKIHTITTVHSDYKLDYIHSKLKKYTYGIINTWALHFIDYYIAVSRNFKEMLISRAFNPEKIFTLYNGLDFNISIPNYNKDEFEQKYNFKPPSNSVIFGILARLHPVKGIDTLLKALKEAVLENKNIYLVIGGDGDERAFLEKSVEFLNLKDYVKFLGFVNDPYEFMNYIDVNLLTSLSESFPYVILEGTRMKKATISSNVGGISDLIEHDINGFLFEPGDYNKLSQLILNLANYPCKRIEFGENIHKKALLNFSLENMTKTQLDIYSSLIKQANYLKQSKGTFDIILSGYYGFNNIGDEAMLEAIIKSFKEKYNFIRILVLSKNPSETKLKYSVNSINRINIFKILYYMTKSKLFINGGGNLIQDNTSSRSLVYYLGTTLLAKTFGMKTMIYGNGIGPLKRATGRFLSKHILNLVNVITVRENISKEYLDTLNIHKPYIEVTADPALTLNCPNYNKINIYTVFEGIPINTKLIGFSVRNWSGKTPYKKIIAELADYIYEKYSLLPVFIPFQYPNDFKIAKEIIKNMKTKAILIEKQYSVSETLALINSLDALIGMRLHALVFAASLGIPIYGMAYEPKVEGFLSYLGKDTYISMNDLELNKLKKDVDNLIDNLSTPENQLSTSYANLKQKAFRNTEIALNLLYSNKGLKK